ncbi:MAG: oligosaccharide flippase family protein [Bacteroidota bacterium]
MNREFLINAIFLVLVNLLIKPFYVFGIERVIQDRVGAETYGLYATLFSFSFLLFMVNDFGIHYFNNRTIAQNPPLAKKYIPNILILKGLLAVLFMGLVFVAALLRGFEAGVFYLLFFVALNHILISLVAYLRSNVSGVGMYRTDSVISTLDKVFLIIICAVLLWANPFDESGVFQIKWFVHAQNIAWLMTATAAFFIIAQKIKPRFKWRPDWPFLWIILKKSFPFALAVFLMTAYIRFDIVILEWMLPDGRYHAGVYAASYRLLDAFNMVGYLFAGLLLPMFSKMLSPHSVEKEGVPSLLRFALQLIWAGTLTLAAACFFFQKEIMELLYPLSVNAENVGYYGETMGYLILTLVPFSGVYIYSTLLTANNSLAKMNRLYVVGIVVNVLLNLLLIPRQQAIGSALAAFITHSVVLAGMVWLAKKELRLPTRFMQIVKVVGFTLVTLVANYAIYHFISFNWVIKFITCILSGSVLAFLFKLIQLNVLFNLVKKKEKLA